MKCGGIGEPKAADEEIQSHCNTVKGDVCSKLGKTENEVDPFTAISYKSQVVAGTNFFVKIKVGESEYVHVRIFRPLPHTGAPVELHSVQHGKNEGDDIEYF